MNTGIEKEDLINLILKRIEEASKNEKSGLILTPKAHMKDLIDKHGVDLAEELTRLGFETEVSKDGNLDSCLRIKL